MGKEARSSGRFATRFTDEQLYEQVGAVFRGLGLAPGETLTTRVFNEHRESYAAEGTPNAGQIATRLKRAWPDIVRIAAGAPGAVTVSGAARTTRRAAEDDRIDERHVVLGLKQAAAHASKDTLTPDEYDAIRIELLDTASRNGTLEFWRLSLPTSAQIAARLQDWDVALVAAGLKPRRGITLEPAGKRAAVKIRRTAGFDNTKRPEPNKKRVMTRPTAHRSGRRTNAPSPDAAPLTSGHVRSGEESLTPVAVVRLFVETQGAWPSSSKTLRAWSRIHDVRTENFEGPVFGAAIDTVRADLIAAGDTPPAADDVRKPSQVERTELPPGLARRGRGNVPRTREECVGAVADYLRYLQSRGRGEHATQKGYLAWPERATRSLPAPRVFARFGGWKVILAEAEALLAAE